MKIVFLNGPPRVGKDTIGSGLISYLNGDDDRFSAEGFKYAWPLKECVHSAIGLSGISPDHFEGVKDTPLPEFNGHTPREMYIKAAEEWLKPTLGLEVFGRALLNLLQTAEERCDFAVVTDAGFDYEAKPILDHYGPENCFLLRVMRQGCDFSNDSRSFISLPGVEQYAVLNNASIENATEAAIRRVYFWMENHVE